MYAKKSFICSRSIYRIGLLAFQKEYYMYKNVSVTKLPICQGNVDL